MKVYMTESGRASHELYLPAREQLHSLVISDMVSDTVGEPAPGSGVQVTEVRSSVTAMIPSLFLKAARPFAGAILTG